MSEPMTYISREACGCIQMAVVDAPERRSVVAREIGTAIRRGEIVERVTSEFMRTTDWRCSDHPRPPAGSAPRRQR